MCEEEKYYSLKGFADVIMFIQSEFDMTKVSFCANVLRRGLIVQLSIFNDDAGQEENDEWDRQGLLLGMQDVVNVLRMGSCGFAGHVVIA